jgi:hypothetical protein
LIKGPGRLRELSASGILAGSLIGCGGGDPTATDPALIFEDGFVDGASQTEILSDGGTITRGLDAWLKLKPSGDLRLRHADRFRFTDCAEAVAWFNGVLPERELDSSAQNLVCRAYSNPAFDFSNGRWFVENRSRGSVYYRVWKHD